MDARKMTEGIRLFLEGLEQRFPGDDLERTPERVARAWCEDLVSGYDHDPGKLLTWTEAPAGLGPVVVRDVSLTSVCVHHLLPFFGRAHVAYLPGQRLAGLSKVGRVIDALSRRLQTQEHLTRSIVETLQRGLNPRGVMVELRARHTCMTLRGVRKEGSTMTTLGAAGVYEKDPALRNEILALFRDGTSLP